MKISHKKVSELADSWINGNRSYVRGKVKNINKVEFVVLCLEIAQHHNQDLDQVAHQLTN